MKPSTILCVLLFAVALAAPAGVSAHRTMHVHDGGSNSSDIFREDNVDVDIEDGSIVFTHDDETVEMTEAGGLLVNDEPVRLSASQTRLVEKYYATFQTIIEEATQIGIEGAKIGVHGAKLGLSAAIGALLAIADERDCEDLEVEIDRKSEKIERMAERLEKRAKKLEAKADRLEAMHKELRKEIDELDDLGWF